MDFLGGTGGNVTCLEGICMIFPLVDFQVSAVHLPLEKTFTAKRRKEPEQKSIPK